MDVDDDGWESGGPGMTESVSASDSDNDSDNIEIEWTVNGMGYRLSSSLSSGERWFNSP